MHFCVSGSITHLRFPDGEQLYAVVKGAPNVVVGFNHLETVSNPQFTREGSESASEPEAPSENIVWTRKPGLIGPVFLNLPVALCVAKCEIAVPSGIERTVAALADNRVPDDCDVPDGWSDLDQQGRIREGHVLPMRFMSQTFRDWADEISSHLTESANNAYKLIAWRYNTRLVHRSVPFDRFMWSSDSKNWSQMPHTTELNEVQGVAHIPNFPQSSRALSELIEADVSPALAHELFCEAWELRHTSPRSALVMGITAVEIGFKQFALSVAPSQASQIEDSRTPLETKLTKLLPQILASHQEVQWNPPPRKKVLDVLRKGIGTRNTIVHFPPTHSRYTVARQQLQPRALEALLMAASDFLWFLDVYSGHEWALEHVQPLTRAEWEQS